MGGGRETAVAICKYKASDEAEPVLVAVKFLRETMLNDRHELSLFVKEAALMRKLKHRLVASRFSLALFHSLLSFLLHFSLAFSTPFLSTLTFSTLPALPTPFLSSW